MHRDQRDADGGFTLIELTITVLIMSIILGALTMGVVTLLRTTAVTTDRLVGSHDEQLLTEWITTDIQSAASAPSVNPVAPLGCSDTPSAPGQNVAQMTWTDRSNGKIYFATYRSERISAGPPEVWYLVRYFCQAGQASTHFPVVRGLKDGTICSGGVPGTNAACVLPASWPRFDLQIVSVANTQTYTFTATATGRTAPTAAMDATPPAFQSAVAYNTDSGGVAGLISRIVVTFGESLMAQDPAPPGQWILHGAPNAAAVTAVAISNNTATLTLSASGSPIVTTAGFTIDLVADPNGVRDGAGNQAFFAGKTVLDGMAPVIADATTIDSNGDARIDQLRLTMSEQIKSQPLDPTLFTVTPPAAWVGVNFSVQLATVTGPTTVLLRLVNSGTPTPQDTGETGFTVALASSPNGVRDTTAAGNFAASTAPSILDGALPVLLSATSQDVPHGGDLDHVLAVFSEPLQPTTNIAQWTFNPPTGPPPWPGRPLTKAVAVVPGQPKQVMLDIDPQLVACGFSPCDVPYDTAAVGLVATLTSGANPIRDLAGNAAATQSKGVDDGMNPVLRDFNMVFTRGLTSGLPENGDKLVATFTEPLTVSDSTPTTVTLSRAAGVTTISIPGLTDTPAVIPPGAGYFLGGSGTASWTANVDRSGATITVTLTSDCSGAGCANLNPAGGTPVAMHVNLATDLEDAVSLPAMDTTPTIQWF